MAEQVPETARGQDWYGPILTHLDEILVARYEHISSARDGPLDDPHVVFVADRDLELRRLADYLGLLPQERIRLLSQRRRGLKPLLEGGAQLNRTRRTILVENQQFTG